MKNKKPIKTRKTNTKVFGRVDIRPAKKKKKRKDQAEFALFQTVLRPARENAFPEYFFFLFLLILRFECLGEFLVADRRFFRGTNNNNFSSVSLETNGSNIILIIPS